MTTETSAADASLFVDDWQAWIVVRHFLPARLQRELTLLVVHEASDRTVELKDLFEEIFSTDEAWNESWIVRPREDIPEHALGLMEWVRSIIWQNDDLRAFASGHASSSKVGVELLAALGALAVADISTKIDAIELTLGNLSDTLQPSLESFVSAFAELRRNPDPTAPPELVERIDRALQPVSMPLRAILCKHLADLCADADRWHDASAIYSRAERALDDWHASEPFASAADVWRAAFSHSRTIALTTTAVPGEEGPSLRSGVRATELLARPMFAINSGTDANTEGFALSDDSYRDYRVAALSSPLRHDMQDVFPALQQWLRGSYEDAARHFWAVLRRQIALAAGTESKSTKAFYAQSILESLVKKPPSHEARHSFELSIRLLIESGKADVVDRISWTTQLLTAGGAGEEVVAGAIAHAGAYEGVKVQRHRVLVALFAKWAILLASSNAPVATRIWKYIAKTAQDFEAAFNSDQDVGRPALKALAELARKRPELRPLVAPDVTDALCEKLSEEFHLGKSEAIDTAVQYVTALDDSSLFRIVGSVLKVLEEEDPARDYWPLSRPALGFLVDRNVRRRLRVDGRFEEKCLEQILRFGLSEGRGQRMIFFHLADFDQQLLGQPDFREKTEGALSSVRKGALEASSSAAVDCISALFVAPFIAGYDGINDAFIGLNKILSSAKGSRPAIGLPYIDRPVLILVQEIGLVRQALADHSAWLNAELSTLVEQLAVVWEHAETRAALFAPFSLPPSTVPSMPIVHNCALASMRLANTVGLGERVQNALERASRNLELRGAIALAHATFATVSIVPNSTDFDFTGDDPESFYNSLGRHLYRAERLSNAEAAMLYGALAEACLRLGPRPADAAVLLGCAKLGIHDRVQAGRLPDYAARVREDRDARLLLLPILDLFSPETVAS